MTNPTSFKTVLERSIYEIELQFEPPSPKGEGFLLHSSEQPRQLHRL